LGTDDASLLERLGKKVKIIMGSRYNIKITTPEDLRLADAIISFLPSEQSKNPAQ
jgi:2-C-methyl-D-erythritol 4-phosphate cytidylyltransferase